MAMLANVKAYGFDDQQIDANRWAQMAASFGADYDKETAGAWKPTVGTAPGEVVLAAGAGTGFGVQVVIADGTTVSIKVAIPQSGSRAYVVVCTRDWVNKEARFEAIDTGGAAQTVPASRAAVPGTLDQEPVAYAVATAGQTAVQIVDLRRWKQKAEWGGSAAAFWNKQPGTIYAAPDLPPAMATLNAAGQVVMQPLARRGFTFEVTGLSWQMFTATGQLRLYWPGGPLPYVPRLVGAHIVTSGGTGGIQAYVDNDKPWDSSAGYFILRWAADDTPVKGSTSTSIVVSKMIVTIQEVGA